MPAPPPPAVIDKLYQLTRWYLERVEKFPRSWRHTLGERLQNAILFVLENTVEAAYATDKTPLLKEANRRLHRVRILTRLATDLRCLSLKQQEYAAKEVDEIGRQIGGWQRAGRKRHDKTTG